MMNQQMMQDESAMIGDMEMSFSDAFSSDFDKALPSYLKMKDALVASDASQVSAFAKATSEKLKAMIKDGTSEFSTYHW